MYCSICGAKNAEDAILCCECHAPLREEQTKATAIFSSKKSKKIGTIAIVSIVIAAIILLVAIGGGGYKSVIKKYYQAMNKADVEAMINLYPPEALEEELEERYMDKAQFIDEINEWLEALFEFLKNEYGKNIKYSCKKIKAHDLSKKELRELKEYYDDEYAIEIKDAKKVEWELTIGKDSESSSAVILVKIDGKWYLDVSSDSLLDLF